jgi:hypothetical protein
MSANFTDIKVIGGIYHTNTGDGISTAGASHIDVSGATCRNNTGDGIQGTNLYLSVLYGNHLRDNGAWGINCAGTAPSGCFIAENVFDTNTSGTITGGVNGGRYEEGSWTPSPTNLTVVGTPTYTGEYTRIGRMVFGTLLVSSTTTTASTADSTYFSGLPYTVGRNATCQAVINSGTVSAGNGILPATTNNRVYTPTWAATANTTVTFNYRV